MKRQSLALAIVLLWTQITIGGVSRPCVVVLVPPDYPPLARMAGIQGTVKVSVVVEKDGTVSRAEAIPWAKDGKPDVRERILSKEAVENIQQWRFKPLGDNSERQRLTVEYVFRMEGRATYYQTVRTRYRLPDRVEVITQPPSAEP